MIMLISDRGGLRGDILLPRRSMRVLCWDEATDEESYRTTHPTFHTFHIVYCKLTEIDRTNKVPDATQHRGTACYSVPRFFESPS
jgi:hypothetical protein